MKDMQIHSGLPPVLREAFRTQSVYDSNGNTRALASNVSPDEALELYLLVRELKPKVTVEIGFAQGISTVAILSALADNGLGTHHVIDPYQPDWGNAGLELVRRAGLEGHLKFHQAFAEDIIPRLPNLDFGFIDGSHLFDFTLLEFILIDKKLATGGVIAFHDSWMPSIRKALRYILRNRNYRLARNESSYLNKQLSLSQALISLISRVLSGMPFSKRVFSPELLSYSSEVKLPNLVICQKDLDDTRDWLFHNTF